MVDKDNGAVHKWGDHDHLTLTGPQVLPDNGLILYLRLDDLEAVWKKAQKLNATIEKPIQRKENSGKYKFAPRDLGGYKLLIFL